MIYRSNITAPDLQPYFKHVTCRPMPHSMGHDVLSDFADYPADHPVFGLYKNCGFWTHDEAAILYRVAQDFPRVWLDIGAHTGWTMAHLHAAGCEMIGLEPMAREGEFAQRIVSNLQELCSNRSYEARLEHADGTVENIMIQGPLISIRRSEEWFSQPSDTLVYSGVVIDGDHDDPWPLHDAEQSLKRLANPGVILLHDASGKPVQKAVDYLIGQGLRCKIYKTPHIVACCWRADWIPPEHVPDRNVARHVDLVLAQWDKERAAA